MKITDPDQARAFFDTNITTLLSPFLARDCTVTRAAEQLKMTPSRMSYWVKKLCVQGWLRAVGHEITARHRVALYRTVHDEYEIPLSALSQADLLEVLHSLQGTRFDQLQRSIAKQASSRQAKLFVRFWREGEITYYSTKDLLTQQQAQGFISDFSVLRLSHAQRDAMHQEMIALTRKYQTLSDKNQPAKLIAYMGFAADPAPLQK
jgi:DNA-binding MarR family transcriptional regulator